MYYEMKHDESLGTLLDYAGGFTGDAYKKSVRVTRKSGSMLSVYNVDEFDMRTFMLMDEDSVSIDSIIDRYDNMAEVKGAVFRPGKYQVGGKINSVRTLVQAADGLTEEAFTARAVMHRMLKDRTLEAITVDLQGIMDGTVADIPLKENDMLFIPTKSELMETQTLTIHGEVNFPGVYRYAANQTLEDFILQAGGLTNRASTVKVDVARRITNPAALTTDSIIAQTFSFALKDGFVVSGENNFTLRPFDEVYVRRSPMSTVQQNVSIQGEVMFAGNYTLTSKAQRLSDLVRQAGGVNDRAFIAGARLERRFTAEERLRAEAALQRAQEDMEANMQELAAKSGNANVATVLKNNKEQLSRYTIGDTYPVGIELDKAMANPGSADDLVLREGDRLIVPMYNGTVKVNGEVMYPNTVSFVEGKRVGYYISEAGGYSTKAKKNGAYIIYMNGRVAKAGGKNKPAPGCEIVVPQQAFKSTTMSERLSVATSVGSFAAIIATIANVLK
jgi:protein involved in polysaccharide export with SLBB domain